jgi:HD superfamily phosphohydrolase
MQTHQVYPGASHARFEHSLGVAHLAGAWAEHLLATYRPEGVLHREDRHSVRALELAGLCHDLGASAASVHVMALHAGLAWARMGRA